jgi:hypothetical protein
MGRIFLIVIHVHQGPSYDCYDSVCFQMILLVMQALRKIMSLNGVAIEESVQSWRPHT